MTLDRPLWLLLLLVLPLLWWLAAVALWIAGVGVAARILEGRDPAAWVLLFSLVAVFWSVATWVLVSRLAARSSLSAFTPAAEAARAPCSSAAFSAALRPGTTRCMVWSRGTGMRRG